MGLCVARVRFAFWHGLASGKVFHVKHNKACLFILDFTKVALLTDLGI